MTRGKRYKESDIGGIAYLAKAGHKNRYIADITGIPLRTVQDWTKRFRENNYNDIDPLYKKYPGAQKKITPRALRILKREVEKDPRITAKQLQEKHPDLLLMSVCAACKKL